MAKRGVLYLICRGMRLVRKSITTLHFRDKKKLKLYRIALPVGQMFVTLRLFFHIGNCTCRTNTV